MEFHFVLQVGDAPQAVFGVFESHAPDNAVYFVALIEQELCEIRTVLSGDAGDQCLLCHKIKPFIRVHPCFHRDMPASICVHLRPSASICVYLRPSASICGYFRILH